MLKLIARLGLSSVVWGAIGLLSAAQAQIVPDTTLPINSEVLTTGNDATIRGGTQVGGNLFHSFERFSVPTNGSAFFDNASTVQNIISRVTGALPSSIDGTIRANGTANLFLINPNGILLGENAHLNIGGSFIASTAERIQFQDRTVIDIGDPAPLLTISVPIGLQIGKTPGNIQLQGTRFSTGFTDNFSNLVLVGGNISLNNTTIATDEQGLYFGGLVASGMINLRSSGKSLSLDFPTGVARSNVSITNQSAVQTTAGGRVNVIAQDFTLSNRSNLIAGTILLDNIAGDVQVDATGTVLVSDSSYLGSIFTGGNGRSGNVSISGQRVSLLNAGVILSSSGGQGNAGDVTINANDIISIKGKDIDGNPSGVGSYVFSNSSFTGAGNGGNVTLRAKDISVEDGALILTSNLSSPGSSGNILIQAGNNLSLTGGSQLISSTSGQGNAGNISIQANGLVEIVGQDNQRSIIETLVGSGAVGRGGDITIEAKNLNVRDGGVISTQSYGQGDAGNLTIQTTDSVEVTGNLPQDRFATSSINASVGDDRTAANGNAGNITITTQRLRVTGGADIATSIFGIGNAGDMKIYATDFIELDGETPLMLDGQGNIRGWGGGLTAEIESLGNIVSRGRGGNMFIETGRLSVSNGSKVQVANFGEGDAGNLFIRANSINVFSTFSEVGGFSTAINAGVTRALRTVIPPTGSGGTLTIETGRLTINDSIRGSEVTVSTAGLGNAGKASIRADVIEVIGEYASLRANVTSTADGNAGDLILNTRELKVLDGGTISVANNGNGIAGNLEINAQNITLNNQGAILGTTRSGQGGDLTLNVEKLLLMRRNSLISTTAGMAQAGGNGGNIFLNAPKGFVIAVSNEDSDIRANAFTGRGGNIQIAAQGIYGIGFRAQSTNLSDISASSQLGISGNVTLNTPDIDPSRGTIELPATVLDRSNQIAQTCAPQKVVASSFVNSGRGSLPPSPLDTLQGESGTFELASVETTPDRENRSDRISALPTDPLLEAQGWVKDAQGKVTLVANANTPTSYPPTLGRCQ